MEVKTVIESGNFEIIESNVIFMDSLQSEVLFHLAVNGKYFGDIRIRFISRKDESHSIKGGILNGEFTLDCINFNDSLGTGTPRPMELGMVEGKRLMMHLWSYLIGQDMVRKIEYSIFKEK